MTPQDRIPVQPDTERQRVTERLTGALARTRPQAHGRSLVLAAVASLAVVMLLMSPAARLSMWRSLGVPAMTPAFADARVVTSGWECTRLGFDVLATNPCDPWERPMNYPRLWTIPSVTGAGQETTGVLALLFAGAFVAGLVAIIGQVGVRWGSIYLLALASPSVMLAIERGNNDLLVFGLVALCAVLAAKGRPGAAGVLVLAATAIKLYPIAAIGAIRGLRLRLLLLLVVAVYALMTVQDLREIAAGTPHFAGWSYGLTSNAAALLPDLPIAMATSLLALAVLVSAVLLWRLGYSSARPNSEADEAFVAGSSIFLATWALGPSWDYRLIFLILTMPMSIEMARSRRPSLLVLSMLALWLSTGAGRPAFIVDQLVQSVLASVLLALLLGRARWPRGAGDSAFASRAGKGSQETGGHGGWGKRVGSGAETA